MQPLMETLAKGPDGAEPLQAMMIPEFRPVRMYTDWTAVILLLLTAVPLAVVVAAAAFFIVRQQGKGQR